MTIRLLVFWGMLLTAYNLWGQKDLPPSLGSPFITNYAPQSYLEAGKNWDIGQGEDGKMYFANNYGIVQFDGYNWERIGQPSNQSELRSFAIHNKRIYIGGTSEIGYFHRNQRGILQYEVLNSLIGDASFTFNDVRGIAPFKDRVFFLTDEGLMMYLQDTIHILEKGVPFRASASGIDEMVFASNDYGIYRFVEDHLIHLTPNNLFENIHVEFILPINPGTYLVGTDTKGVLLFDGKNLKDWNKDNQKNFVKNHLTHATILNKEFLLFGSLHEGLVMTNYEGEIINIINEKDGLLDHNILSIYKDQQGNIWTAVDGSAAYLELNSPFTILNKKNGLRGEIYCILQHQSDLYVGTSRGLYRANWNQKNFAEIEFNLLPETTGQCWQLFEHQGNILLAHHNGIFLVDGDRASFIGGGGNWNFAPIPGEDHLLLSGNYTGIALLEKKGNSYKVRHQIKGFQETTKELVIDEHGLWIPHGYKGVYRLSLAPDFSSFSEIKLYNSKNGLPSDLYNNVISIDKGVFFGTQNGVYQYNAALDRMEPNSLFSTVLGEETLVRKLLQTPYGSYFSIKNYDRTDEIGLIVVLDDGSYSIRETPFQKLRGQLIPAFEAISFLEDDYILVGGKQGLIIYDAGFGEISLKVHQCYINEISLPLQDSVLFERHNGSFDGDAFQIKMSKNEALRFSYSSSFFEAIPYMNYSTYLEGYDVNWQDWDTEYQRDLLNLPEGEYTFWVKSRNIYDVEGYTSSFPFEVIRKERSFNTSFFSGLFVAMVLFLLGFYFFLKGRTRGLKAAIEKLGLELLQKKEKIEQLKERKSEWKKEKEQINQKLSNALLQNEIHAGLIQKIEHIAESDSNPKALHRAVAEFQDNLKGVQVQMDAHNSLETDDFLTKIKTTYPSLSARELRLCSYLKLNVSSKEIAEYLGISVRGVESLRYRVRKKLDLKTGQDLTAFILKL